ncbi:SpoIIE family protein phosphatase [Heliophilum fasciatum]|uniref:SpoIIE family protein phosphatase n=1 Tax=Heliophilum fasciatum TaxID=35700 RepID=UPI001404D34E|nr:SpoIIE family protein phosphatase [Heliophilum fasciatum]MCW2276736.1 anti-sigma regulatory factor (Ser/Thr protein kinase) [Heliophilum fasciatum]
MNLRQRKYLLDDASQIGEVRRAISELARLMDYSALEIEGASIVVTEMATNLLKHTRSGGEILMRPVINGGQQEIELLGIDKGPGIACVEQAVQDGFSTAGSPGTGLGAIHRLSQVMDIYSQSQKGTIIQAKVLHRQQERLDQDKFDYGVVHLPKPGETECGDGWLLHQDYRGITVSVVDGLGHGAMAAEAAQQALAVAATMPEASPLATVQAMHEALRNSRGAAVAVASIDLERAIVTYCGVGNIIGRVVSAEKEWGCLSHEGIVGLNVRKWAENTYPWTEGARLVMASDGMRYPWDWNGYPGLQRHACSTQAAVLYRDYCRHTDDVTVVIVQQN